MEDKKAESTNKNVKKANLLEHNSIKHILDESVSDIVKSRGYKEDVRLSNLKLILGTIIIVVALVAQFYNKKFPENRDFLIGCIASYPSFLYCFGFLILYTKEKNAILFTYPPEGSFTSTGLVVSSKLPRFSDEYTLTIDSADPKSISAGKSVQLTKSVTQWFTKDGVLVEGLFWKDVEALIKDYAKEEPKKKK
ncbi:putative signal peptidase complex subunit 2 [Raphanus sativus]|nr:putative signal peptidase complex subunit 2 [Raphanus sativus]